ncbi:MAG: sialidase [Chlorobi bacterium]|nr:sialidase [Chlorobiota bacterium]
MKTFVHQVKRTLLIVLSVFLFFSVNVFQLHAQQISLQQLKQLKFRYIGPVGNRIISVAGIPDKPLIYYVGAASGGIWKTVDGGLNWKPIFDDKPVHSIGALAVAPSDHEVVYAGTGESFIRSNVSIGDGVWKSTDGGETWKHIGLEKTGRISRIVIHPENPDIAWVAALGHAYAPQKERGIFMTTDGGNTWKQVLFVDENTGASDIVMDPENPRILFAGMWQLELKTWVRISGGPGSGLYKSTDGGITWKKLEKNGLPTLPVGKIALAMTPANPNRVYALIETGDGVPLNGKKTETGELWRSDNLGKTWMLINSDRDLGGRQAYYTRCAASPDNPNEVYFISNNFLVSIDGGKTAKTGPFGTQPNWDHHEMWIDPTNGNRMIVVGDGGLSISLNRGKSWDRIQLPVAQVYHVTTDNEIPYNVLTNRQDGPSMKGPSRTRVGSIFGSGMIPTGLWHDVGGGESGFATPDPEDPDVIWSSTSGHGPGGGIVVKYNEKTRQYRQVEVWPELNRGHAAEDVKYRFQWTFPLLISPHDHNTIYVGSQYLQRTTNGGQSWEKVSPDLTLNDKSKQGFSGGLTGDNINVEYADVIYAIDESPVKKGVLWIGTNDGLVQLSQDNGKTWTNVTKNIPDLPKLGVVRNIDASKWEAGKAYVTIDFHQLGNFDPYVYKTGNYGKSWKKIVKGISDGNLNYVRNIREDPVRPGLLYLGTENALYVSFDDGENWQSLMTNLPHTPMYWIDVQEHFNDLVIGTYGRGIWILDDITPLQQLTGEITSSEATLFGPKPAYRFQPVSSTMQFFPGPSFGKDPPYGASIHYWLGKKNDSIKLVIKDKDGNIVRTLREKGKPGINRVWWDLRGEPTQKIIFRTKPQYAGWYSMDKTRTRKSKTVPFSILEPPGTYTVEMVSEGKKFSEKLVVLKDPHSEGTLEDIREQTELMEQLYNEMNKLTGEINKIERIRRQLSDMKAILQTQKDKKDVLPAIDSINISFLNLENKLIQLKITGTGQDDIRYPSRLAESIAYLASVVAVSDFPPTDQDQEVHKILQQRLDHYSADLDKLLSGKFAAFLELLSDHNIGPIVSE